MGKSVKLANMPNASLFSAFLSAAQTISSGTFTKVTLDGKDYDTNNNFASSRFTATIAGYYRFSAAVDVSGSTSWSRALVDIVKNGATRKRLADHASGTVYTLGGSTELYLAVGDYVELNAYVVATTPVLSAGSTYTWMTGSLVRAG